LLDVGRWCKTDEFNRVLNLLGLDVRVVDGVWYNVSSPAVCHALLRIINYKVDLPMQQSDTPFQEPQVVGTNGSLRPRKVEGWKENVKTAEDAKQFIQ
jgi:hypothetical protein